MDSGYIVKGDEVRTPWEQGYCNQFGFRRKSDGMPTFLDDYIRDFFLVNGITTDNFPLLANCPECKSAVTAVCTEAIRDGSRCIKRFHQSRIDAAKARLEQFVKSRPEEASGFLSSMGFSKHA